jgi:hypothetical protein
MQPCALIIPYSNMKLLKTFNNFTIPQYPWCNVSKLRLPHMIVLIWLIVGYNNMATTLGVGNFISIFECDIGWWSYCIERFVIVTWQQLWELKTSFPFLNMILNDGVTTLKYLHFNHFFKNNAGYCARIHYAHGRHYLCILVIISGGGFWGNISNFLT